MTQKKLPTQVWLLSAVSFFADVSGEMIYPLLPLFIVAVLRASATDMGWIEGLAQGTVALVTAWAGIRSDRFRKRVPWVRWGYSLPVVGKAILVVASSWPLVLLGRTVDRLGKGFRGSPRDALIADVIDPDQRGRAFGLHRALDTAGALVGVVTAAVLLYWLSGTPNGTGAASTDPHPYRIIFAIAAAMGLCAAALTFVVKDPAPERAKDAPAAAPAAAVFALPAAYWKVFTILILFSVANSSDTFLLLRAQNVGLSAWAVVAAYAMYNVLYAAISYPAGVVSDRLGRWRVIAVGWVLYAGVYAGVALANATTIWPLFCVYGIYMALTDGVGKALIADVAPKAHRGRAMGIFYLGTGVTTILSSVIAGVMWDRISPSAPFWLGAGTAVVALLVLALARPRRGD
ncbi:MAG TPA: MFS transporter [Kofleriaceae bacterium]